MTTDHEPQRCDPRAAFGRRLWWSALAVLVVNDHVLKGSGILPGVLTGKLSDFAGLIVAPALFATLLGVKRPRAFVGCAALIACVFASIKTSSAVAGAVEALTARLGIPWKVWCDPTDLVALPALLAGLYCGRPQLRPNDADPRRATALHYAAVLVGGLACLATSFPLPRQPRSVQADDEHRTYVAIGAGSVRVIEARSGRLLRKIELGHDRGSDWVVNRGRVYGVGSEGVVAYDVASGKRSFQTHIECATCPAWVVAGGERVFVFLRHPGGHGPDAALWAFALDGESGRVIWYRKLESPSLEDEPDVVPLFATDTLVVPTEAGLLAVSPESGTSRWVSRAKAPRWVAVADRRAYFVSEGELFEVPLDGGPELWKQRLWPGDSGESSPVELGVSDALIVYCDGRSLTALDRVSKQRAWEATCSELMRVSPEVVLAMLGGNTLAAFDVSDGRKLWETSEDYRFEAPVVIDGLVVVRVGFTDARAYDARTGWARWTVEMREP